MLLYFYFLFEILFYFQIFLTLKLLYKCNPTGIYVYICESETHSVMSDSL